MKKLVFRSTPILLGMLSAAAVAHPGDHGALTSAERSAHFAADPWHLAMALAATLAAYGVLRSLHRRWRRSR